MTGPASPAGLAPFGGQASTQPHSPTRVHPARLQLLQLFQPPHIPGKVSLKLQWTAIKCKGHRSWAFEADVQSGGAGRPRDALTAR